MVIENPATAAALKDDINIIEEEIVIDDDSSSVADHDDDSAEAYRNSVKFSQHQSLVDNDSVFLGISMTPRHSNVHFPASKTNSFVDAQKTR